MQKTLSKLRNKQPITIVVIGDSNTVVSMNTQGKMNCIGLLAEALWERYGDGLVTMVNVSECGYNFVRLAKELDDKIRRWQPDLVLTRLWLGAAPEDGAAEYDAARAALAQTVTEARATNPEIEFLICTPNPRVFAPGHELADGIEPCVALEHPRWNSEMNADLKALAEEHGCTVVDHFTAWKEKTYNYAHPGANPRGLWQRMMDVVHPNAVGHLAMFREMAPVFDVAPHFLWEETAD